MPVGARCTAFVVALLLTSACHEELGIGEPESRLRDVLETEATPWLPWSDKKFFDSRGSPWAAARSANRIRARLFVKLKQRFGPEAVREAIVEYRLTNWWRLQTSVAEGDAASRNLLQRVERGGIDMLFWFSY